MKRYTVAQLRRRLADVLNEVERGEPVVIERRGMRYVLRLEPARKKGRRREPMIEILDPSVEAGQWTWTWTPAGLRFHGRVRKPRRK
jgi:prevent-host-death family protein